MSTTHLDKCDKCGKRSELYYNESTGLSYCEECDMENQDDFGTAVETAPEVSEEEFAAMAATPLLFDADALKELHDRIWKLADQVDDTTLVPDRYGSSFEALTADHDSSVLRSAGMVLHRMSLMARYKGASREINPRYWVDPNDDTPQSHTCTYKIQDGKPVCVYCGKELEL